MTNLGSPNNNNNNNPYMRLSLSLFASTALLAVANAQVPSYVPTAGLAAWYSFTGNANDDSGLGNNGTVNGATLTAGKLGVPNTAYSFDGVSNRIDLANPFLGGVQNDAFTFHALVRANSVSTSTYIWSKTLSWGEVNFGLLDDGSIILWWANSVTGNKYSNIRSQPGIINNGVWYDIVVVFQNSGGQIYLNGSPITTDLIWMAQGGAILSTTAIESSANFAQDANSSKIGLSTSGGNPTAHWNGIIDEFGIWDRALTPSEISGLYDAQGPQQCVSATPVNYSGLDATYMISDAASSLTGTPSGGVFIGPGIVGDIFDPSEAGLGTHSIMYVYVDENNCVNSAGYCTTVEQSAGIGGGSNLTTGGVRVYPNPNLGQFTVELDLRGLVSLQVYDARGRVVHNAVFNGSGQKTTRVLDLSSEAKGTYTVQVQNNGGTITQSVVIE